MSRSVGDLSFRRPTWADADRLALQMRDHDRAELRAAYGHSGTPEEVRGYVEGSQDTWACDAAEGLMCLFGVSRWPGSSMMAPLGVPWMLGTPVVERHPGALVRATRTYIAEMLEVFPVMTNFVDARNTKSVRYLRASGFTIHAPAPYGVEGLPFHRFTAGAI